MCTARFLVAASILIVGAAEHVKAEALLQLYAEGAHYYPFSESWVVVPQGPSFRLWVIGNVAGPGGKGPISNVRLSAAYSKEQYPDISITLTPSIAGGTGYYNEYLWDSSPPAVPTLTFDEYGKIQTSNGFWGDDVDEVGPVVKDGSAPVLSDGKLLPWHGTFGPEIYWEEFYLGHFTLSDSPIGDFIYEFPEASELHDDAAQINVYEVSVTGGSAPIVQFDVYNHVDSINRSRAIFAPFSHDVSHVPAPSTLVGLMTMAATGLFIALRRRFKKS